MDVKFLRMWFISMNLIRKKVNSSVHADLLGFLTRDSPGELAPPCTDSSVYRKKCEIMFKKKKNLLCLLRKRLEAVP